MAGGLKKGQWSKSEDELLSMGVEQFGPRYDLDHSQDTIIDRTAGRWTVVASCVGSRSADRKHVSDLLFPRLQLTDKQNAQNGGSNRSTLI